jgi:hypothetical protein
MSTNKPLAWKTNGKEVMRLDADGDTLYAHPTNPYKAITNTKIEPTVVSYTHPVKELTYEDGIEECAQRAEAYAYMSPNFTVLAEELRAILRKAQENV